MSDELATASAVESAEQALSPPRRRREGWRQCNVEIPESVAKALAAHLAITQVPKADFVLLAVRNEVLRQRRMGLGLNRGKAPAGGGGIVDE